MSSKHYVFDSTCQMPFVQAIELLNEYLIVSTFLCWHVKWITKVKTTVSDTRERCVFESCFPHLSSFLSISWHGLPRFALIRKFDRIQIYETLSFISKRAIRIPCILILCVIPAMRRWASIDLSCLRHSLLIVVPCVKAFSRRRYRCQLHSLIIWWYGGAHIHSSVSHHFIFSSTCSAVTLRTKQQLMNILISTGIRESLVSKRPSKTVELTNFLPHHFVFCLQIQTICVGRAKRGSSDIIWTVVFASVLFGRSLNIGIESSCCLNICVLSDVTWYYAILMEFLLNKWVWTFGLYRQSAIYENLLHTSGGQRILEYVGSSLVLSSHNVLEFWLSRNLQSHIHFLVSLLVLTGLNYDIWIPFRSQLLLLVFQTTQIFSPRRISLTAIVML